MSTIEEKITKLLALSQSSNENEASAAAQRAAQLIEAHNVDRATLGKSDDSDIVCEVVWRGSSSIIAGHISCLTSATNSLYGAKFVFYSGRNARYYGRGHGVQSGLSYIRAVGRKPALAAVKQTLSAFLLAIESGLAHHAIEGRTSRHSYRVGAAAEILHRAQAYKAEREQRARDAANGVYALVRTDARAVTVEYQRLFPKLSTSGGTYSHDSDARAMGRTDGANIALGANTALGGRLALPSASGR